MASCLSFGGPQIPSPVRRIEPKPRRYTFRSPPMVNVPLACAGRCVVFCIVILSFIIDLLCQTSTEVCRTCETLAWEGNSFIEGEKLSVPLRYTSGDLKVIQWIPQIFSTERNIPGGERVTDGAWTHNRWSHNPELCRLSYGHHAADVRSV